MKVILAISIGIIVVICGFFALSEPTESENQQTDTSDEQADLQESAVTQPREKSTAPLITPTYSEIEAEVTAGEATLLDTRTVEEFNAGHAPAATLFSLQRMEAGEFPNISKDEQIYLYCRSGNRSTQAANLLEAEGFTDIINLGGLSDIQALGAILVQN